MKSVKYEYKLSTTFEGEKTTMGPFHTRSEARDRKRFIQNTGKFGKVSIIQLKTVEKKVR